MLDEPALKNVQLIIVGIQLIDSYRVVSESGEDCGALQRPVLTSPFAIDLRVNSLCVNQTWDAKLGKTLFSDLWVVRYASSVRSLLMPQYMKGAGQLRFNSRKDGESINGFEPHRSIGEDKDMYDSEFARWKAQYQADRDFVPLQKVVWSELTSPSGFFDQLNDTVRSSGKKLALFAVPTNPVVIDIFNRRDDYLRNSKLLREWADNRGVVFIDTGIQDVKNPESYFSDMRHLSGYGAAMFSRSLGNILIEKIDKIILN
ncbi:MAG: hypothetical protein BVN35_15400 [Proteobacteria bacterium ST_bin11]|nr:MAG: hypothetical protein BVN35_15400 [Proteobacteria bacterium ST_bin11]